MLAVNDGGDQVAVHLLDAACQVVDEHTAAVDPYDPEDMALGADGTVWLADTGDNNVNRPTVALLALHPDGTTGVFRLSYPDGPHDAEALLLAPDGTPYLVTKEVLGASKVYRPASALVDGGTVALAEVAVGEPHADRHPGRPGGPGRPADGHRGSGVRRRHAPGPADLHRRLRLAPGRGRHPGRARGDPGPDPAAGVAQGEAISFTADNQQLLVASEGLPSDLTVVPLPAAVTAAAGTAALGDVPSLTDLTRSGLSPITSAVIAALVATVVVWIVGLARRATLTGPGRRPPERRPARRAGGPAGVAGQTRRRTVTTRPRMVASSPGIGSYAGLCGSSHTCPSRRL